MPDIDASNSAGEIEIPVAIHVFDHGTLRPRGKNGRGVVNAPRHGGVAAAHQLL